MLLQRPISSYSFKYLRGNVFVYPILVHPGIKGACVHEQGDKALSLHPKPLRKPRQTRENQRDRLPTPQPSRVGEVNPFQSGYIYTVPLKRKQEQEGGVVNGRHTGGIEVVNAVVSFTCPKLAAAFAHQSCDQRDSCAQAAPIAVELNDLKHYASILRLPLITIVNAYCTVAQDKLHVEPLFDYESQSQDVISPNENYELYYYYKPHDVIGVPFLGL